MMGVEKEDWNELIRILKETEGSITALGVGDWEKEITKSRQSIQAFHVTASMLGLSQLEMVGTEMEKFLNTVDAGKDKDSAGVLGFAIGMLIDQMGTSDGGDVTGMDMNEVLEMLGVEAPANPEPYSVASKPEVVQEVAPADQPTNAATSRIVPRSAPESSGKEVDGYSSRFAEVVRSLGGELTFSANGKEGGKFNVTFSGSSESLKRLDAFLAGGEIPSQTAIPMDDKTIHKIVTKGQEFMSAFSGGDIVKAQDILLGLADQSQPGLYKEIGGLARGLHDSIRNFINTMDPSLKEMVEDKIPDSGNRLEHMLELTEKAANTTIDHVEAMQDRLRVEKNDLKKLSEIIGALRPIGDQAEKKVGEGMGVITGLIDMAGQHRSNLDAIIEAQDYQDLSGQIILKIINLLNDIELKLVNVIRTFGVKIEGSKTKTEDELYGPAHNAREDAVHSQDEVDALLAEFGF